MKKAADVARGDLRECVSDGVPQFLLDSGLGAPQGAFHLGPHRFYRIEVATVRRQIPELGAGPMQQPSDRRGLVRGQIVHHDDGPRW